MCACEQGQETVAALEGRGDQPWAGVTLVAPKAGTDKESDGVGPPGPRGHLTRERDVRDLAEECPVESEACAVDIKCKLSIPIKGQEELYWQS